MKTDIQTIVKTTYQSEIMPEVKTDSSDLAEVLEWADANPRVWRIITHNKSKAFGRNSCMYMGWAQGNNSADAVLERLRTFYDEVYATDYRQKQVWGWRARFTLEHYKDKGFKGGLFQQWNDRYPRGCLILDYTPETLEEVIDKFVEWCGKTHNTRRITVDEETVKEYRNFKEAE